MGVAPEILASQLEHYGHGRAMWSPEPIAGEVRIGDVGHVDEDGAFHRMFNVTVDADHPLNRGGVPEGFKPLRFNHRLLSIRPDLFPPSPFCSRSAKSHKIEGHLQATTGSVASANLAYNFECASSQGGLLVIRDYGTKTMVMAANDIVQYIRQNHDSWYNFATGSATYGLQCKPEDIVMVRGTVKTSSWAVAAFNDSGSHTHDVQFSGQVGPFADAGFQLTSQTSRQSTFEQRSGPSRKPNSIASSLQTDSNTSTHRGLELPELEVAAMMSTQVAPEHTKDQTVFLSCYKIKRRMWITKRIIAAGEAEEPYRDDQPSTASCNIDVELNVPHSTLRTFVDEILDYILRHSDAEVAVVSEGEISEFFPDGEWPDDMGAWLRDTMPTIDVDDEKTGFLSTLEAIRRNHAAVARERELAAEAGWEARQAEAIAAQQQADIRAQALEAEKRAAEQQPEFQEGSSRQATGSAGEGAAETQPDSSALPATAEGPMETEDIAAGATEEPAPTVTLPVAAPERRRLSTDIPIGEPSDDADDSSGMALMPYEPGRDPQDSYIPDIPDERMSGTCITAEAQVILGGKPSGTRVSHFPHTVLIDKIAEGASVTGISVSKTGRYIATGSEDAYVRVYDMEMGSLVSRLDKHEDTSWAVAFSPDETRLVSGGADNNAFLWDLETHDVVKEMTGHDGDVWVIAYSPNGKLIATGSVDCTGKLWDGRNGEFLMTLEGHNAVIMCVAFSLDGTRLATCADSVGFIWDTASGQQLARLEGHTSVIWSLGFSADSSRIVTASEDQSSRVWDSGTGDELVILNEHTGPVWTAVFSPDGRVVASGSYDSTIVVCDSFTGDREHMLERDPSSIVNILAYSKDGDYLASGLADGRVRLWDAHSGAFLVEFRGHEDKVKTVEFTPDDNSVVSSSDDGTVRIWGVVDALRL